MMWYHFAQENKNAIPNCWTDVTKKQINNSCWSDDAPDELVMTQCEQSDTSRDAAAQQQQPWERRDAFRLIMMDSLSVCRLTDGQRNSVSAADGRMGDGHDWTLLSSNTAIALSHIYDCHKSNAAISRHFSLHSVYNMSIVVFIDEFRREKFCAF